MITETPQIITNVCRHVLLSIMQQDWVQVALLVILGAMFAPIQPLTAPPAYPHTICILTQPVVHKHVLFRHPSPQYTLLQHQVVARFVTCPYVQLVS